MADIFKKLNADYFLIQGKMVTDYEAKNKIYSKKKKN
jgi:hypothetical protein